MFFGQNNRCIQGLKWTKHGLILLSNVWLHGMPAPWNCVFHTYFEVWSMILCKSRYFITDVAFYWCEHPLSIILKSARLKLGLYNLVVVLALMLDLRTILLFHINSFDFDPNRAKFGLKHCLYFEFLLCPFHETRILALVLKNYKFCLFQIKCFSGVILIAIPVI